MEIKYRRKDLLQTMDRLDPLYHSLLAKTSSPGEGSCDLM